MIISNDVAVKTKHYDYTTAPQKLTSLLEEKEI